eukprot:CAMPEP_0185033336 /NCGR_PEP_ID=MMETSP1103-20130426/22158_1 /TAXON_ID=36769 /ORGANISM="Paraphysomonas bandaiensis, Strain Caron Lab Isolate" /LENGTH=547 /DNA_ID=CAMNT_0027569561 /DNA_START=33 /DNA_END=1676 /DNA_ORIENTATION=-
MTKWSDLSLKTQMLTILMSLAMFIIIFVTFCTAYGVYGTDLFIFRTAKDILIDAVKRQSRTYVTRNSISYFSHFTRATFGCVGLITLATEDANRPDYALDPLPSYPDYVNVTYQDLSSSFYYPNFVAEEDYANLTSSQKQRRDHTSFLDTFFVPLLRDNQGVSSSYVGLDDGMTRSYPFVSLHRGQKVYDPRQRPWYKLAMKYPGRNVYTPPYIDYNDQGWVLTVAHTVRNSTGDGRVYGVAAADLPLATLQRIPEALYGGKTSLFMVSGEVIVDMEWNTSEYIRDGEVMSHPYTYADLRRPVISRRDWNHIRRTPPNSSTDFEIVSGQTTYFAFVRRMDGSFSMFITVTFVERDSILTNIDHLLDDITTKSEQSLWLTFTVGIVVGIVTLCVIYVTVDVIVKPLNDSIWTIEQWYSSVGYARSKSTDHADNSRHQGVGKEQAELRVKTAAMFNILKTERSGIMTNLYETNPFWGGKHPYLREIPAADGEYRPQGAPNPENPGHRKSYRILRAQRTLSGPVYTSGTGSNGDISNDCADVASINEVRL